MPPFRIVIVDDHFLIRMGLAASISRESDFQIAGEEATARAGLALCVKIKPDIALIDIRLPDLIGTAIIEGIKTGSLRTKVVAISTHPADEYAHQAYAAGASAFLLKSAPRDELLTVLRSVAEGKKFVPEKTAALLTYRSGFEELTAREREVLSLMARGFCNKEIGGRLGITEGTIKIHVKHLMAKLHTRDRTATVMKAAQRGLLDDESSG